VKRHGLTRLAGCEAGRQWKAAAVITTRRRGPSDNRKLNPESDRQVAPTRQIDDHRGAIILVRGKTR
jgi:hypothetical protein